MRSLREVCELTGVDRHVLQRIGTSKDKKKALLPPTKIDESSGYWYYDDDAIEKLWLILLFRELECPFKKIQEIMEDSDFDQRKWFGTQIELLIKKQKRIDRLIHAAEMIKTTGMYPTEYSNAKDYKVEEYLYTEKSMISAVSEKEKKKMQAVWSDPLFNQGFADVVALKKDGFKTDEGPVQQAVKKMRDAFIKIMGEKSEAGFLQFGMLLFANGDIAAHFDEYEGVGVSTFVGAAIKEFCK